MNKLIILFTLLYFSSICRASSVHIPEEGYKAFTLKTFLELRQSAHEKFVSFNLDEIIQAPKPTFKTIESRNFDLDTQVIVHELFEGETKIISKQATDNMGKYLYIPEINNGVALIASGHDFIAAAHFVENNEKNMVSFLRNLKDQNSAIDTLTVYGGFCSEVVSHLGRILKEENITINFARIFPVLIFGNMKRGFIESSKAYACVKKLKDLSESCESVDSEVSLLNLFNKLEVFPCCVVVDCSDGSLIDLKHSLGIISSQTLFNLTEELITLKEFSFNNGVKIPKILNLIVLYHLIQKLKLSEITSEEFDYRLRKLKIEWKDILS